MPAHAMDSRRIRFDSHKYGAHLLVDAAAIETLPGYITSAALHQLTFFEIALIRNGAGAMVIDGDRLDVKPYGVIVTAPGETRAWRLHDAGALRGRLAFFEEAFIEDLAGVPVREAFPFLYSGRAQRALDIGPRGFDRLANIIEAMRAELAHVRNDSVHALRARLYELLVEIQRASGVDAAADPHSARSRVARFRALVEQTYRNHDRIADYASALHVSPRHLNECVRRATGRTASEMIHDRLALEARRMLLQSTLPIGRIAEALGFANVSYFTRFFRRMMGVPPGQFRRDRLKSNFQRKSD